MDSLKLMPRRVNRVLVVRGKYHHMGSHSGYGRIMDFMTPTKHLHISWIWRRKNNLIFHFTFWLIKRTKLLKLRTHFYKAPSFFTELLVIAGCIFKRYSIVHYLTIEDNYCLLNNRKIRTLLGKNLKIIGTIHQPISWWKVSGNLELLKKLDEIVVLTKYDEEIFSPLVDGKVTYVPHGVDSDFFVPGKNSKKYGEYTCLFIGNWLRNIPLLKEIISLTLSLDPTIRFKIIYPLAREVNDWSLYEMSRYQQVEFLHGISDDELKRVYQQSHVLVLPLIDCTANNSILEAMSCGLPIITSDLPGIRTYIRNDFAIGVSDVPERFSSQIFSERDKHGLNGDLARDTIETYFSWKKVSSKMVDSYISSFESSI